MRTRRSNQLLLVAALFVLCLEVIFQPLWAKPTKQNFDLRYPVTEIEAKIKDRRDKKKSAQEIADDALLKIPDAVPTVKAAEVIVNAKAHHQQEARAIAKRVTDALSKKFDDIPAPTGYADKLPEKPLRVLGPLAVFRPQPHLKMGLDLQGGSHLVLQLRHTIFVYKLPKKYETPQGRDKFAQQVRGELTSIQNLEAEIPSRREKWDQLILRTQAASKSQFEQEKDAIDKLLTSRYQAEKMQAEFTPLTKEAQDQSVEIVRNRVDALGVGEVQILKSGADRIVVEMPGVKDPQEAQAAIKETAMLEFRLLPEKYKAARQDRSEPFERFVDAKTNNPVSSSQVFDDSGPLSKEAVDGERTLTGRDLMPNAYASRNEANEHTVNLQLKPRGAAMFAKVTTENVNKHLAIFIDRDCISAPNIREPIPGGRVQISGGFQDANEAKRLALLLNSGALPVPLDIIENRTISATLGGAAVRKSVMAGLFSLVVVMAFMITWYALPGVLANFALIIYLVLNLAILVLFGATITLPGIAGIILSMAMSVDTNILVFERLKEELRTDKTFKSALQAAFDRAWTAILDSHVTTLIAGLVLYNFGTGSVKGFALTLSVGVLSSLFTAFVITRVFVRSASETPLGRNTSLWLTLPVRLRGPKRLTAAPSGA